MLHGRGKEVLSIRNLGRLRLVDLQRVADTEKVKFRKGDEWDSVSVINSEGEFKKASDY